MRHPGIDIDPDLHAASPQLLHIRQPLIPQRIRARDLDVRARQAGETTRAEGTEVRLRQVGLDTGGGLGEVVAVAETHGFGGEDRRGRVLGHAVELEVGGVGGGVAGGGHAEDLAVDFVRGVGGQGAVG